jgi:hypothetical protein
MDELADTRTFGGVRAAKSHRIVQNREVARRGR